MQKLRAEPLDNTTSSLGESPLWDPSRQTLAWVDVSSSELAEFNVGASKVRRKKLSVRTTAIALFSPDRFISAGELGFAMLDHRTGIVRAIHDRPAHSNDEVMNDGKCDRRGRFWAGTKDASGGLTHGAIYRLGSDMRVDRLESGFGNVNGIDWSPDDRFMYVTDTRRGTIYRYAFDAIAGSLGTRESFVVVPQEHGRPDGLTIDSSGFIWSANWDGGCVLCYSPAGRLACKVSLPTPRPTSCTFGAIGGDVLFITSARSNEAAMAEPLHGSLFSIRVNAQGQAARFFRAAS